MNTKLRKATTRNRLEIHANEDNLFDANIRSNSLPRSLGQSGKSISTLSLYGPMLPIVTPKIVLEVAWLGTSLKFNFHLVDLTNSRYIEGGQYSDFNRYSS
jgi:hypothetical protein